MSAEQSSERRRVEELEELLRPLASMLPCVDDTMHDDWPLYDALSDYSGHDVTPTVGDVRRAAAALTPREAA